MNPDQSPPTGDRDSLTPTPGPHAGRSAATLDDDTQRDADAPSDSDVPSAFLPGRDDAHERDEPSEDKPAREDAATFDATRRESTLSHLPSPPLTRSNSRESTVTTTRESTVTATRADPDEKTESTHGEAAAWHPLHGDETKEGATQDLTVIVEDGEQVVDSSGKLLFPEDDEDREKLTPSRRTSHLRLDLTRSREPQPWDLVDPPDTDGKRPAWGATPRGFNTMRSNPTTLRPLIPRSNYFTGPPPPDAAFGTAPVGQIGVHHPREIVRVERDYSGGELIQFAPIYPLELEGRITPTQFLESINAINELLIAAHSTRHAFVDNTVAVLTLQLSRLVVESHYDKNTR
ncbi:Golgin subfamily A member 7/ERF4 family-domain-containing protein [Schizophyllum amplum]|uniref:Ras modification protein ERF4 n=1 Tax=Schizophyllum amplum TaxID=97359 RepID=A0A550CDP1_9AGAR|nr:Golgin subfamily A member 7/ERF4 family-domain-containing protein [Auriculariopsis ampla]